MIETATTVRIAMWSGPRNLSTALMRAFENRPDCSVVDEPFYAAYLLETGQDHPLCDAVLASQSADPAQIVRMLLGPVPDGQQIFYQKHMTHHMRPHFDRAWISQCRNAFLIRTPYRVLASYAAQRDTVTLADVGYRQQAELFDAASQAGEIPPVIDADDLRTNPEGVLKALCQALHIPFLSGMLAWPPGPRPTDGVWAPAWYDAVNTSTGFAAAIPGPPPVLPPKLHMVADAANAFYHRLAQHKLCPVT